MNTEKFLNTPMVSSNLLEDDGVFPNNKNLGLLVYQNAMNLPNGETAGIIENLLSQNSWGGSWCNGIYNFHHYHSIAHEVLVVYRGKASVQFGGENEKILEVKKGDVVIIPAGVAHKRISSSFNFRVVGAYPQGQTWDMNYGKPSERPQADLNIQKVSLPSSDPIYGSEGPIILHWIQQ